MALCAALALPACKSAPPVPAASPVFFNVARQEAAAVHAVAREQERQIQTCATPRACDRAHYLRALAALYEDRAVAVKHFRAVSVAQAGPYAESSRAWIRLLAEDRSAALHDPDLVQAAERAVRDVLEREAAAGKQEESQTVHALRQQVKEQDKRIHELTQQIDALKRVDEEVKERIKPGRSAD
jgi:hypothetical protein